MSVKRRAKLKFVAGGDRKTTPRKADLARGVPRLRVEEWFRKHSADRPYAAIANRRLRFARVNDLLKDRPPSIVRSPDNMRIYLFRTGEDRDLFVENFHYEFKARGIVI